MQVRNRQELQAICQELADELKKLGESTKSSIGLRTYRYAINSLGSRQYSATTEAKKAREYSVFRLLNQARTEMKSDALRHLRRLERKRGVTDVYQVPFASFRYGDEKNIVRRLELVRKKTGPALTPSPAAEQLSKAISRGDETKRAWVQQGHVMPGTLLAAIWGISPRKLRAAVEHGDLVALKVGARLFYPEPFLHLDRDVVQALTSALGQLSKEEKFLFWMRPHGALGGKTPGESLREPALLEKVRRLAEHWATEAEAGA